MLVALPGVDVESAQVVIEDGELVIAGTRMFRRSCGPQRYIASNCRKAVFIDGCGCRPAATAASAARSPMAAW